ncbi:hypothetical protein AMELA_G00122630 [Ameiurus melas]|uniref:Uncharacterized protein n=1 Tax=Ameiurus melas TaxID=219545 RepID=A0A7J6AP65_AMEME|nr:hypothetical protein AMELA_G00122630 [Ameiurus melas]
MLGVRVVLNFSVACLTCCTSLYLSSYSRVCLNYKFRQSRDFFISGLVKATVLLIRRTMADTNPDQTPQVTATLLFFFPHMC